VRCTALTAAVVVITACSRSPDRHTAPASEEFRVQPPAAHPDPRRVLVAFGDSLTAGFGAEPGRSYPDYLQRDIDKKGYRWRVVNEGVSGDTTTDGLARLSQVIAQKPEIVILELGANDGLRGLPIATTKANLERMIQELEAAGARVVLAGMTLPPNYGPDYIRPFEDLYKELASKYKITLIPFLLAGVGGNPGLMQQDGLHPTAAGNRKVADNVMAVIEPLLKEPPGGISAHAR
jgi:acyl-CoA thioesterase-1